MARAIVDLVAPTPADLAVEIGPGQAAPPGSKTYGSLSVHVQLHWRVELALRVPPRAFRPPPKVESAVLRLRPLPAPRVDLEDEQRFEAVVRAAFAQRRKTLANALAAGLGLSVGGCGATPAPASRPRWPRAAPISGSSRRVTRWKSRGPSTAVRSRCATSRARGSATR